MEFSLDLQYMGKDLVVINGKGQFDTFYCSGFMIKVGDVANYVSPRMVGYNFRQVSFINSTSLGALIQAGRILGEKSPPIRHFLVDPTNLFVENVMGAAGILNRVIPYKTIPKALEELAQVRS